LKKRSKVIAVLMTACMVGTIITGCKGNTTDTQETANETNKDVKVENEDKDTTQVEETEEIVIWHEVTEDIAKTIEEELNQLSPDIKVKLERKEKLGDALKLAGNDPESSPDMYFYAHDKLGTFALMGILAPITDFVSEGDLSDLLPMTIKASTYQSVIYELPIYFETQMFMYNKALMSEAPSTTDKLLEYMKEHTTDSEYGFVEQHSTAYYASAWIHAFGAYIIDSSAAPGLNSKEMKKALEYHKQFVSYMPLDGEYNTITTLFKEGKAHSIIGGPWLVPEIKEAGIDLGIAPMPTVSETGKPLTPYSGVQGVCVLKHALDKKDAVTNVLKQLMNPELGIQLANTASCAPANSKCYKDSSVSSNEMISAMKETAENVIPMPNIPEMDVMWQVIENMLANINKSGNDVENECESAQTEALAQIDAMK
jgi:arabinogalactan oligomer/maltooligosaccharide transport system substrate-binding protein